MRAGASNVQQTLTPESAAVLKHAVAEARRRGHAQATPLHVAASLLAAPASPLRRACMQAHQPRSSHPLHCRALELCFKVALDRFQAAQGPLPGGQPSYSNALVAALKRAQAHQRRGCPEQQQQPLLAVKVELEQLAISILDDPGVSRVMREAGFSSPNVKNHLEEVVSLMNTHSFGSSNNPDQARLTLDASLDHVGQRLNVSPTFLGNISLGHHMPHYNGLTLHRGETALQLRTRRASFYMNSRMQHLGEMDSSVSASEDVKRLVEVLLTRKRRNPVLVGQSGMCLEACLKDLMYRIDKCDVPEQLLGVKFISALFSFWSLWTATKEELELKFRELNKVLDEIMPGGAIIHIGDLQWLLEGPQHKGSDVGGLSFCPVQYAVAEIGQILSRHGSCRPVWLIGTATCQTYLMCQAQNPSLEGQWELQPVPISTTKLNLGLQPRYKGEEANLSVADSSPALITPCPALIKPLKISMHNDDGFEELNCCPECIAKYEQDLVLLHEQERHAQTESPQSCSTSLETSSKETDSERCSKDANPAQPSLPLWLQKALPEHTVREKAIPFAQRILELIRKWNNKCQSQHVQFWSCSNISSENVQRRSPPAKQTSGGSAADGKALMHGICDSSKNAYGFLNDLHNLSKPFGPFNLLWPSQPTSLGSSWSSVACNETFDWPQVHSISFLRDNDPSGTLNTGLVIGSSVTGSDNFLPVRTDLSLASPSAGLQSLAFPSEIIEYQQQSNFHWQRMQDQSGCSASRIEHSLQASPAMPSNRPDSPVLMPECEQKNIMSMGKFWQVNSDAFERLCNGLTEWIGWQKSIISDIATTVMQCRSGMGKRRGISLRGDTWFLFLGPDQMGKKRMAQALAEFIFGCEKRLIYLRFGNSNTLSHSSIISNLGLQESGIQIGSTGRGRLPLDQLAEAIKMNPFSVVLLEDVDQADSAMKNSLICAIEKGKLPDSTGREVSFNNVIVVMTSSIGAGYLVSQNTKSEMQFTEKRLAALTGTGMRLVVGGCKCKKVLFKSVSGLTIVNHNISEDVDTQLEQQHSSSAKKRKADWNAEDEFGNIPLARLDKKMNVEQELVLDLNLSAEENKLDDVEGWKTACEPDERQNCSVDELSEEQVLHDARKHMKDLCDLVDAVIVFHPFDFEALADMVIDSLSAIFVKVTTGSSVEIDMEVLEQIMAAVWTSGRKETVLTWAAEVLDKSLSLLHSTCCLSDTAPVKLLLAHGTGNEVGQNAVLCLPQKITVDFVASH